MSDADAAGPFARGLFVSGTDTGVGKTVAAVALVHALRVLHGSAVGMKPVASGCVAHGAGWRNDDALALQAASSPRPAYADVNPYAFAEATAPQLAARAQGVRVSLAALQAAHARLAAAASAVVVEGAGGWLAPMDDGLDQSMLVRALGIPVVLVVGLRLGCLSHARLSARAIAEDGCVFAGWIGSAVEPSFARHDDYVALLREAMPAPCLGLLPHAPHADAAAMSRHLDVGGIAG